MLAGAALIVHGFPSFTFNRHVAVVVVIGILQLLTFILFLNFAPLNAATNGTVDFAEVSTWVLHVRIKI